MVRIFPLIACQLLFLLLPLASSAAEISLASLKPDTAAAIDEAVKAQIDKQKIVGLAVGIVQHGQIALLKSYGLADRESKSPVTNDTVFNWASNSKPLAAVLAMQLVERKALDLDADVRKYVPEFPEKTSLITTRDLLCHQSGIPHYSNGEIIATDAKYNAEQPFLEPLLSLNKFNKSPLIFEPRARTSYSSYAYILLSAVVQRAGQQPFGEQLATRISQPLELKSLQLDLQTNGQPHWATGYTLDQKDQIIRAPEEAHYWKHGAGGFKSNIADFARWAAGLVNHRLVSAETENAMWTLQKPTADGKPATYALGFQVTDEKSFNIGHGGSQTETKTHLLLDPRTRSAVVVMCNCSYANVKNIATELAVILNR